MSLALESVTPIQLPVAKAELTRRAARVAAIAAAHAQEVDRDGRFPHEALAALKVEALLGVMVPVDLGGGGASLRQVLDVCYVLGRACASTAMIFAMHQIKAACLIRHTADQPWQADFLRRVADRQLLLASSTTEGQNGGDVRSSAAPIQWEGARVRLDRDATVMSYGAEADAVVTTARRNATAAVSDQVLAVFERADYALDPTQAWETLGMRGTRSGGFALHAEGLADQIVEEPYSAIHARTMTPTAHLLWSGVWAGIAADAVCIAQRCLRRTARKTPGQPPMGATHYTRAATALRTLQALTAGMLNDYEARMDDPSTLDQLDFQTRATLLKIETSELAVSAVMSAMRACGLSGYRTDGDASLARHLRDVLSAPMMINNDRILANLGASALLSDVPASLVG